MVSSTSRRGRRPRDGRWRRWLVGRVVAPLQRGVAEAVVTAVRDVVRDVVRVEVDRAVRAEADRAVQAVAEAEFRSRRDLLAVGEREAALSSGRWALEAMPTARTFTDPESTLRYALELAPQGGMALEFGVFAGRSLSVIAE